MASVEVESAATTMPENLKSDVKISPEPEAAKEEIVSPPPISNPEPVTEEPKEDATNEVADHKEPTPAEAIPAGAEKDEVKDAAEEAQVVVEAKPDQEEETEAAKEEIETANKEIEAAKEEIEAAKEEAVVEEKKEETSPTKVEEEKPTVVNQVTVEKNEE